MVIYKTTNLINGKEYIGYDTKNRSELKYLGSGRYLKRAIKKYGKVNFKKRILCKCNNIEELREAEKLYIELYDTYNNGYNLTLGGEGVVGYVYSEEQKKHLSKMNKGKKRSRESIEKQNNSRKGFKHSEESKRKMSINSKGKNKGKKPTKETRKKMSESKKGKPTWNKGISTLNKGSFKKSHKPHNTGKKWSKEVKEKIRQGNLGNKHTKETKLKITEANFKAIIKYSLDNNIIKIYKSIQDCEKDTGLSYYHITQICRNKKINKKLDYILRYK